MKKVVFCIIMAATIFATMEVALKIGGVNLDSFQLTAVRFLIGGLILAPAAYFECRKSGYRLKGKDVAWMALLGIVGIAISMVAFQMGVLRCNAATAAPLFCTNPLYAMVIAHIFTSEKMDTRKWIAFALGVVAAIFMIRPWDVQEGNTALGFLHIPQKTKQIAQYAFSNCTSLGTMSLPDSLETIQQYCFNGCSSLSGDLVLPERVRYVQQYAFYGCSGLTGQLSIPDTVYHLGMYCFAG